MLKAIVWEAIINDQNIATLERKACRIIDGLFEELCKWGRKDTQLLFPNDFRERLDLDMALQRSDERYALVLSMQTRGIAYGNWLSCLEFDSSQAACTIRCK